MNLTKDCHWDYDKNAIFIHHKQITLTAAQTKLLKFLVLNISKPVSNTELFDEIWENKEYNEKSIRSLISKTRKILPHLHIQNIYGGFYMLQKTQDFPDADFKEYLLDILDQSQNPIIITDPNQDDNPIIYVNEAFTAVFGFLHEEVVGKNCRFLHKDDSDQLALFDIRHAIKKCTKIRVNIRNYKKNGKLIHNELTISPIFDKNSGKLKYFLGIHKDVTYIDKLIQQVKFNHL